MKVCGFCGASGAGKTTLIEGVIRELKAAGKRVSVVKHAGHGFDIDVPGKDSHRLRSAGAFEVIIASKHRLAKMREFEVAGEASVHQMLAELAEVDWALVEGYKHADLPRIEVWRAGGDARSGLLPDALPKLPPLYADDPFIVAVATDSPQLLPVATARPVFALHDARGVAAYLLADTGRHEYTPHG